MSSKETERTHTVQYLGRAISTDDPNFRGSAIIYCGGMEFLFFNDVGNRWVCDAMDYTSKALKRYIAPPDMDAKKAARRGYMFHQIPKDVTELGDPAKLLASDLTEGQISSKIAKFTDPDALVKFIRACKKAGEHNLRQFGCQCYHQLTGMTYDPRNPNQHNEPDEQEEAETPPPVAKKPAAKKSAAKKKAAKEKDSAQAQETESQTGQTEQTEQSDTESTESEKGW